MPMFEALKPVAGFPSFMRSYLYFVSGCAFLNFRKRITLIFRFAVFHTIMTSKNIAFIILILCGSALEISCSTSQTRLAKLEKSVGYLQDSLQKINNQFVRPFEEYQAILNSEFDNPPLVTIGKYEKLIENYGSSYWAHESKKRITNIKDRSKYWTKEKGWELLNEIEKERGTKISCPGC